MAPLLGGLFRFRENRIAVNADVKEMFHQVRIIPEDQQCQRFLWRDCIDSMKPKIYIMQAMMFGPTCSPACAQFIKNSHAKQFIETKPEAVKAIIDYTYVDDLFDSHDSVEKALKVSTEIIEIFDSMSFNLVGFQSNSKELLAKLPSEKLKNALVCLDHNENLPTIAKVLGIYWNPDLDYFTFQLSKNDLIQAMVKDNIVPTKREILKTIMRIYDAMGLIAHYTIRGKIIQQEVWREGIGWDEKIPEHLQGRWREFITQLSNIEKLKIRRWYSSGNLCDRNIKLIIFVDASEFAYAATAYLRFEAKDGTVDVAHVMGKARVAPIKKLTIPQLELMAALLGVRMSVTIKELHSFKIDEILFLSDSKCVLAWICSQKCNFKFFVAARIGEMLESSEPKQYFHVRSKENVADDATKCHNPEIGDDTTRWFRGPEFLKSPRECWPITPASDHASEKNISPEARLFLISRSEATYSYFLIHPDSIENIGSRFKRSWSSLIRVIAYMLRIQDFLIRCPSFKEPFITPEEFSRAELEVFKKIQYESFPEEVKALMNKPKVPFDRPSKIQSLSPIFVDGLLRMSSRSQKSQTSYAARNPVILPNKHQLVELFIRSIHEKNFHMGQEMTIADVREKAWVVDTRAAVKRVTMNCQLCKNLRAKPQMPLMGQLPTPRLDFGSVPFTHVGVDAFGPYQVKYGRGTRKRYGIIFTCLTFRAVHLEVLNDMSTEQCIMAINRFLSRRGQSRHFYSDNGKNFVGAKNILLKDMVEIKAELGENVARSFHIHWHFIPAYSPWWGGAWERLIQSIKKCIDFVLSKEVPREDIFANAMIEAEAWMNRRPLTHIPIDSEDAPPLTPNSALFQFGKERTLLQRHVDNSEEFSRRATRRVDHLVNKFLSRWTKEYLPEINKRSKWFSVTKPVKENDIVIYCDPSEPRNAWKKARVIKAHSGEDGIIRRADIVLADNVVKENRAVGRLAVLDVNLSPSHPSVEPQTGPGMLFSNSEEVQSRF